MFKKIFIIIAVLLIAAKSNPFNWLPVSDLSGESKEIIYSSLPRLGLYAGASDDRANYTVVAIRNVFYMDFEGSSVYKYTADLLLYDFLFEEKKVKYIQYIHSFF
jgi:hypothetical protein